MNELSHLARSPWPERCLAAGLLIGALVPPERLGRTGLLLFAVLALAGLAAAGSRVAPRLTDGPAIDRAVAAIVAIATALTFLATLLGHFGWLRRELFWGLVAGALGAASCLPATPRSNSEMRRQQPAPLVERGWWTRVESALCLAAAAWLLSGVARAVAVARLSPPGGHAFDDLSYHLSAVAVWWHAADLRMLKFAMGDPATAFYPLHGELLAWVELSLLSGSDFLARFAELPFALAVLAAVAAIARRLELGWPATGLAVALAGTIVRIFPQLMLSAGNDLASAFFVLAVFHGALLMYERVTRGRLVYAGLALGLLIGTKYAGVLLLPVIGLVLAIALAAGTRRAGRSLASSAALLVATAAISGGYAYLRNLVTTGNPLFPAPLELFGRELLPGRVAATPAAWRLRPEYPIAPWHFLLDHPEQLGILFAALLLPAALLAPGLALARRARSRSQRILEAALFGAPLGFYLLFLAVFYDHRDARYLLAGAAMAAVALAWLAARIPGRWGSAARSLLALAALLALRRSLPLPLAAALAVVLLGVVVAIGGAGLPWSRLWSRRERLRPWWPAILGAMCALLAARSSDSFAKYESRRLDGDRAAATVEALTHRRAVTIAYVGWNQPYLFFGNGLRHRVRIVPTFADAAAEYYTWGGTTSLPHDRADRSEWLANLRAAEAELVVVRSSASEEPEAGWIRELPERFERLWGDGRTEIWSFDRRSPSAPGG